MLTNLKYLNISENAIDILPPELGLLLGVLTELVIAPGNLGMTVPPYSVAKHGTSTVLQYLRSLHDNRNQV